MKKREFLAKNIKTGYKREPSGHDRTEKHINNKKSKMLNGLSGRVEMTDARIKNLEDINITYCLHNRQKSGF